MSFDNDQYLSNMIKGAITDVCFTIRRMVYSRALSKRTQTKFILVDIGTGRGQSLSCLNNTGQYVNIYVEPNGESVKKLLRKRRNITYFGDSDSKGNRYCVVRGCGLF